jgi:hypothetical protein
VVKALMAGMMETTVPWPCVSTLAAYSGPEPGSGVITREKADPRLAPRGAVADTMSV